jgi:invasion protein IalB
LRTYIDAVNANVQIRIQKRRAGRKKNTESITCTKTEKTYLCKVQRVGGGEERHQLLLVGGVVKDAAEKKRWCSLGVMV